jgi:hypothetical protein
MFDTYGVAGDVRSPVYAVLGAVWLAALAIVVRRLRRDGQPLLDRGEPGLAPSTRSSIVPARARAFE